MKKKIDIKILALFNLTIILRLIILIYHLIKKKLLKLVV